MLLLREIFIYVHDRRTKEFLLVIYRISGLDFPMLLVLLLEMDVNVEFAISSVH